VLTDFPPQERKPKQSLAALLSHLCTRCTAAAVTPHLCLDGVEVSEAALVQLDVLLLAQGLQGQGVKVEQLGMGRAPGRQLQA
jgi:hypothetical protein